MADPVRDFGLSTDGDMAFANGDRVLVSGAAAVRQGVKVRILVFLGEVILDQTIGVDYRNQILIKNPDPLVVRELIKDQIASVPDVLEVVGADLQIDRATRTATIRYQYRDKYSTRPIDDSVSVSTSGVA